MKYTVSLRTQNYLTTLDLNRSIPSGFDERGIVSALGNFPAAWMHGLILHSTYGRNERFSRLGITWPSSAPAFELNIFNFERPGLPANGMYGWSTPLAPLPPDEAFSEATIKSFFLFILVSRVSLGVRIDGPHFGHLGIL